jgi:predicted RNase H-like HicB family nuclease
MKNLFKISNIKSYTYLAVFEPSETGYGVYFPDLAGCISYGETFEQAQINAKEALELHIYGMKKDGDIIPEPSEKPTIYPETEKEYLTAPVTIFFNVYFALKYALFNNYIYSIFSNAKL